MAVSGLAMGIIDTIANFRLVSMYKKDSAIFLQVSEDVSLHIYTLREVLIYSIHLYTVVFISNNHISVLFESVVGQVSSHKSQ